MAEFKLVDGKAVLIHINILHFKHGNNIAPEMKIIYMTKIIRFNPGLVTGLLIVATCCLLDSCKKVNVNLGTDFVDNSTTNLVLVDSTTLEISTIYVDSFMTSGAGSILVGGYSDPAFGNINSNSFIQLGAPASFSIPNGAVFDSLELILTLNKTWYGDTSTPYSVAVHRITDPIKLPGEQLAFYNTDKCDYQSIALGSKSWLIRPTITDTLSIPVSQALGRELFTKMFNSDATLTQNDLFIDYFKGLALVSGTNNNLVVGFKDSATMRLHYRNPGVISTGAYVDFGINNTANQFNNITANRSGTPIASLGAANRQIFSPQTQNAGFSQFISGAVAKIRFPYLRNLLQLSNFVKIIRADLVIKPVKNSFTVPYTLPPGLRLSQTDQYNLPGTDLSASSSSAGTLATQYGNLYIDNLYGTETAYTYDITTYLQEQIAKTDINKDGVLVLDPNPGQRFDRVMIADGKNAEVKSQVKIYYATVK
ncbi:MAG: hypothetical protein JWP81_4392 [Ferruginibacter sp.]|nr:hypothetical protein [Ferruginibacter sp.]